MFCGNIFTSTDLQNHKKNHMKKSPKRFHRVNRASFLSLSNEFEDQKLIPKISPKKFWSAPCFPKIVCGVQCVDGLHELSIFHCLRRELLLNRYYTATMDQTIQKWVEEGKNLFVVAENEEGEVYTQGSSQVVEGVEEHVPLPEAQVPDGCGGRLEE